MKRIHILWADYEDGNHGAVSAIAEALKETHGQEFVVEIATPQENEHAPVLLGANQGNLANHARELPDVYTLGYQISDCPLASNLFEGTMTLLLFNLLREIVCQHPADAIVHTHRSTRLFYRPSLPVGTAAPS